LLWTSFQQNHANFLSPGDIPDISWRYNRIIPKIFPEISRRHLRRCPEDIPGHILSFPAKYDWPYPAGKLRIWLVLSAIFWSYPEGIRGNNPDIFWRCNRKYPKILLEITPEIS
jgi:hypothetical protein